MSVLGFRCSNSDITYAHMTGNQKSPILTCVDNIAFPPDYQKGPALKWWYNELQILNEKFHATEICIKGPEHNAKMSTAIVERLEIEGLIFFFAANHGITRVMKKIKSTLAKDLGQKGKSRYLASINTSVIPDYEGLSEKKQEAVLAAWSRLRGS